MMSEPGSISTERGSSTLWYDLKVAVGGRNSIEAFEEELDQCWCLEG
jgi:hypothetical protein